MTRISLEVSRLPQDVLTYTDEKFFEFIESFCGKDGSDLLSIQAIRSVDSLLSIQDVYSIFELDSDDVQDIQKRCGFRKRNGTYIVRPGIRSSLDQVSALLKEMKKKTEKTKKIQSTITQSTITQSTTSLSSSFDYDIESDVNVPVTSVKSKKNKAEHHKFIEKSIKEWCIKNGDIMNISDDNPVPVVNYNLTFNSTLDKVEINCSCRLSFILVIADSGNFKLSNYFRHLKTHGSIIHTSVTNSTINNETPANTQDSISNYFSEQTSTITVQKRTRRAAASTTTTKKIRTA